MKRAAHHRRLRMAPPLAVESAVSMEALITLP
jgi:hypothetical protein